MSGGTVDWAEQPGFALVRVGAVATLLFALAQVLAAALAVKAILAVAVVVALGLFVAGVGIYVWGFLTAVGRSRDEEVDLPGLFLLADAPGPIRRALAIEFVLQVAVAFATAFARPFSSLAFGILVPLFGGGLACLWAARFGEFPPRGESRAAWQAAREEADAEPNATAAAGEHRPTRRRWFDPVDLDDD